MKPLRTSKIPGQIANPSAAADLSKSAVCNLLKFNPFRQGYCARINKTNEF